MSRGIVIRLFLVLCLALMTVPATVSSAFAEQPSAPSLFVPASDDKIAGQIDGKISLARQLARQGMADRAIQELDTLIPQVRAKGTLHQLMEALNLYGSLYIPFPHSVDQGTMATNNKVRSLRLLPPDRGKNSLSEALEIARREGDLVMAASILNNIGTLHWTRTKYKEASHHYRESVRLARQTGDKELLGAALANQGRLYVSAGSYVEAVKSLEESGQIWLDRPDSTAKGEALIGIGQSFRRLAGSFGNNGSAYRKHAVSALSEAARSARSSNDSRLMSYSAGYLGGLVDENGERDKALVLTREALFHAQMINSPELLCLWQWQLGRILNDSGEKDASIAAYRMAVRSLQALRRSIKPEAFYSAVSFREMVEPVYLGFIELLLNRSRVDAEPAERERLLREVQITVENLRTEELQDYFKDNCLGDLRGMGQGQQPGPTAVIYLISMPTRLEILMNLPSGPQHFTTDVTAEQISLQARELTTLVSSSSSGNYLHLANKLYTLIIRPIEEVLKQQKIEHLVFVPDGILRTVPMAVLHDGKQFLISRYTISTTQGLQLINQAPRTYSEHQEILLAGISKSINDFPALPSVQDEVTGIQSLFRGKTLLNESFVKDSLEKEFEQKPYSYVHLATHGEFAGDMHNMFILAWDGLITFEQFDKFIRPTRYRNEPIELLTLSACKTAAGDDRAVLGLAGIAVKAGAKSTLATLWEISDEVTAQLVQKFYNYLKQPRTSKASALQKAQMEIMQSHSHPYYWSPFLLIGNWL
ncbi:tetratricopeptide repeat protein 28 [Geobacter sp. OR-1]|uniref:CHAT domain-containing protein n=1 Tax=Geobacter sp. OR-1 TaxID=1266765 RepID=UPI000543ACBB|nr:CHAT domain-containing protein [Geobacter sp. OR-1]GAM09456.1 tetratricopeptide repeat protein 28 [Geobacter sp. OR-1]